LTVARQPDRKLARQAAFGGILAALAVLCLYLAATLPTLRLFCYGLSSVFIAVLIIETRVAAGWLFFAATALLALLLVPNKLRLLPYLTILGHYGIWKYHIESRFDRPAQIILKLIVLNAGVLATYYLAITLFMADFLIKLNWGLLVIALQGLLLLYDYTFTLFVSFYLHKLKPSLDKRS